MHTVQSLRAASILASAVLVLVLSGCSGGKADIPGWTGPPPSMAQSGQVLESPLLDSPLTAVDGGTGVTVPDANGGVTLKVSKTGTPKAVANVTEAFVPADGLEFVAVEVGAYPQTTPFPTFEAGTTAQPKTIAQFLVNNAQVGQPVTLPVAGEASNWTVTAPKGATVALQITSGTTVQTLDARTGQPLTVKENATVKVVTLAGEDGPVQKIDWTENNSTNTGTASLSMSYPSLSAYLTGYVEGAGWAPDGQAWLFIGFQHTVTGISSCDRWDLGCADFVDDGAKASMFTLTTSSGQPVTPFGETPTANTLQLLYPVADGTTGFTLAVDSPVNIDKSKSIFSIYQFTPAQLDFTHTYTLSFQ